VLKDCCKIEDNTVLPTDTVVPPFTVFGGVGGRIIGELPECFEEVMKQECISNYDVMQLKK